MRLDLYLSEMGLFDSRSKAKKVIEDKRVSVNGVVVEKASYEISEGDVVEIAETEETEFVGRGGKKLEHAFNSFDISAEGKVCLDIGASTGGFTQCLLINGAKKVYAVDSGTNQLDSSLRRDERVISMEGFNARNLTESDLEGNFMDMVVMDVSFISQKLLYPAILRVAKSGADVITLIKPQFEAGKQNLGKKGVVKDKKVKQKVVDDIISFAKECGFDYVSHVGSPILGGDGNEEFLLHLKVK